MAQKVAVCTLAYREEAFIPDCIEQFKGLVDTHLVLYSDKGWAGKVDDLDKTVELAEKAGADVISSWWESEEDQRNFGQHILKDYDWILIIDADERISRPDAEKLIKFLETADRPAYGAGRIYTYWGDWRHRVDEEGKGLIIAVRPSVNFVYLRCIDSAWWGFADVTLHHGSYIRSDEAMKIKCEQIDHNEGLVSDWWEDKWVKSKTDKNVTDLHPVYPANFPRIIEAKNEIS